MGGEFRKSRLRRGQGRRRNEGGGEKKESKNQCCPCPPDSDAFLGPISFIPLTSRGIPREAASKHWSPGPSAAFSHEGAPANSTAAAATILGGANSSAPPKLRGLAVVVVALSDDDDDDEEESAAAACLASGGNRQLVSGSIARGKREERERKREKRGSSIIFERLHFATSIALRSANLLSLFFYISLPSLPSHAPESPIVFILGTRTTPPSLVRARDGEARRDGGGSLLRSLAVAAPARLRFRQRRRELVAFVLFTLLSQLQRIAFSESARTDQSPLDSSIYTARERGQKRTTQRGLSLCGSKKRASIIIASLASLDPPLFQKQAPPSSSAPAPQKSASAANIIPDDGPNSLYPPMPACPLACDAERPPRGTTVPFDTKHATGSEDLLLSDPLLSRPAGFSSIAPEQIKVQLGVDGAVVVSWVTGKASVGRASDFKKQLEGASSEPPPPSVVKFGRSPESLGRSATSASDPIVVPGSPDGGADGAVSGLLGAAAGGGSTIKSGSGSGSGSSPLPPQPRRYLQSYGGGSSAHSYLSGWNHHVLLRDPSRITPGERVYYKVGSGEGEEGEGWSEVRSFVAPPRSAAAVAAEAKAAKAGGGKKVDAAPPPSPFPMMLSFIGDLGTTENSTSTLRHVAATSKGGEEETTSGVSGGEGGGAVSSAALLVVGDLVYADNYEPDGKPRDFSRGSSKNATYQPRWDAWGRMASSLGFGDLPVAAIVGNHDVEADGEGKAYKSFLSRFEQAAAGISGDSSSSSAFSPPASSPEDPTLWAKDIGPARVIGLNTYAPYHPGSTQRKWLEKALNIPVEVRNSTTPWLIVLMHAPWYTSYATHYREVECLRASLEPLFAKAGVDLVFSGHVHAYERTYRVLNHFPSPCGPVHVTVGDGGNAERLYTTFADGWGIPEADRARRAKACPSKRTGDECAASAPGPYCYDEQPPWSAFREPSFGHGTLVLESKERATWRWHRNQDGERVVSDEFVVLRGGETCEGYVDGGE